MDFSDAVGEVFDSRFDVLLDALHELAVEATPRLKTAESAVVLASLDLELPNLAHLLDALLLPHPPEPLARLFSLRMISLLTHLEQYLSLRGLWREKLRWCASLVNFSFEIGAQEQSILYNLVGTAIGELGDPNEAIHFYQLALEYAGLPEGDPELLRIYSNLGVAYWDLGQLEEALFYNYLMLQAARQQENLHDEARALANLAQILFQHEDVEESLLASLAALDMALELGDAVLQAEFTAILATHLMGSGQLDDAAAMFERALTLLEVVGDEIGLALARLNHAVLCQLRNEYDTAWRLAQHSLAVFERYGMPEAAQARALMTGLESATHLSDGSTTP